MHGPVPTLLALLMAAGCSAVPVDGTGTAESSGAPVAAEAGVEPAGASSAPVAQDPGHEPVPKAAMNAGGVGTVQDGDVGRVEMPRSDLVEVEPGLRVVPGGHIVEFDAIVCLDDGFLEQIVCSPGTREHEALLVTEVAASKIHAALLVAGFESGTPGRWHATEDGYGLAAPTGSALDIDARYERDGATVVEPVRTWVTSNAADARFPDVPWIFGGSVFVEAPPGYPTEEVYAADFSGSIVGLVTFGDELIGLETVIADAADLEPETWIVNTASIPAMGTPVIVVVRKP